MSERSAAFAQKSRIAEWFLGIFCCVMAVISMALPPFVVKYYTTFFPPAPFIKITPSPQVGKGGNSLFVFIKNHP